MEAANNKDELLKEISRLTAQNQSLKEQLQDCEYILSHRSRKIDMLEKKIAELTVSNSQLNNYMTEVEQLESNIENLKYKIDGSKSINKDMEKQILSAVSIEHSFSEMEQKYNHLQTQLTELQNQLQKLNDRNLILLQQNSRVAELESLLDNKETEGNFDNEAI